MSGGRTHQTVSFLFVVVSLSLLSAGTVAMLAITARAATTIGDPVTRKLLARLAWLSLVLLCLSLLLLVWSVLRYARRRLEGGPPLKRSRYVDAWALAGQRFQLDDSADDEPIDQDEAGDEPDNPAGSGM